MMQIFKKLGLPESEIPNYESALQASLQKMNVADELAFLKRLARAPFLLYILPILAKRSSSEEAFWEGVQKTKWDFHTYYVNGKFLRCDKRFEKYLPSSFIYLGKIDPKEIEQYNPQSVQEILHTRQELFDTARKLVDRPYTPIEVDTTIGKQTIPLNHADFPPYNVLQYLQLLPSASMSENKLEQAWSILSRRPESNPEVFEYLDKVLKERKLEEAEVVEESAVVEEEPEPEEVEPETEVEVVEEPEEEPVSCPASILDFCSPPSAKPLLFTNKSDFQQFLFDCGLEEVIKDA